MITSLFPPRHIWVLTVSHPPGLGGYPLWIVLSALLLATAGIARGQSRDIRSHAEYGGSEGELRLKYEFYHDMWSERDVKHGRYAEWASHDRLKQDGFYFDGLQDSLWRFWTQGGQLIESSWWESGDRHGKTCYYDRRGRIESESNYRKGKLEGLKIDYYPSGKVSQIAQYHQGALHGKVTRYDRKGEAKKFMEYVEGRPQKEARPARPTKDSLDKPQPLPKAAPATKQPAVTKAPMDAQAHPAPKKAQAVPENSPINPEKPARKRSDKQAHETPID